MTPQERTELQRLAEVATPGRWRAVVLGSEGYGIYSMDGDLREKSKAILRVGMRSWDEDKANAAYIAAANPVAILALLSLAAESEELRAELEKERAEKERLRVWANVNHDAHTEAGVEQERSLKTLESRYEAAKEACEALAQRYGATVEWDEEGMPGLTMPENQTPEEVGALIDAAVELRTSNLESRYTALEKAARAHVESWARSPEEGIPAPEDTIDALAAALTPKEGE